MTRVAVVYHSGGNHTAQLAEAVHRRGVNCQDVPVEDLSVALDAIGISLIW